MNSDRKPADTRHYLRLKVLSEVIIAYDGSQPLHRYLASFFKSNPGFGSSDRKLYRRWVYAWFRLGRFATELEFNKRILIAYFLVNGLNDELSLFLNDTSGFGFVDDQLSTMQRLDQACSAIGTSEYNGVFPFTAQLTAGVDQKMLTHSMLNQPDVFIRVKRGMESKVKSELNANKFSFEITGLDYCWKLPSGTNLQELKSFKSGFFEVQDYGSQAVANMIPARNDDLWWDACSGAGGKSLFLADKFPGIQLLCTDKRDSILENLKVRLNRNRYRKVSSRVLDAVTDIPESSIPFNGVLVDAPCSGSGTWSRNPENLVFFDEYQLTGYSKTQSDILKNVSRVVPSGSYLVYMTCSVFAIENEQVVLPFIQSGEYQLFDQKMLLGYMQASDSLYVAALKKN